MKRALTADIHFAKQSRYARPGRAYSRLEDRRDAFVRMIDTAARKGATCLSILGDLVHDRYAVSPWVIETMNRCLAEASKRFESVEIIPGNHDCESDDGTGTSVYAVAGFPNVRVMVQPEVIGTVGFLPWRSDPAYFDKWTRKLAKQGAHYLFSHALVREAGGGRTAMPAAMLNPNLFKRVMLGDVHEPVNIPPNVQYLGGFMQFSFDDAGGRRGFWLFDDEVDKLSFCENKESPRFHNVEAGEEPPEVRPIDYVRLRGAATKEQTKTLSDACPWVEVESTSKDASPRLVLTAADPVAKQVKAYVRHVGKTDAAVRQRRREVVAAVLDLLK